MVSVCINLITIGGDCMRHSCARNVWSIIQPECNRGQDMSLQIPPLHQRLPAATAAVIRVNSNHKHSTGE